MWFALTMEEEEEVCFLLPCIRSGWPFKPRLLFFPDIMSEKKKSQGRIKDEKWMYSKSKDRDHCVASVLKPEPTAPHEPETIVGPEESEMRETGPSLWLILSFRCTNSPRLCIISLSSYAAVSVWRERKYDDTATLCPPPHGTSAGGKQHFMVTATPAGDYILSVLWCLGEDEHLLLYFLKSLFLYWMSIWSRHVFV